MLTQATCQSLTSRFRDSGSGNVDKPSSLCEIVECMPQDMGNSCKKIKEFELDMRHTLSSYISR
ncbi:hypothetical protein EHQ95_04275 [Leptospira vanthielii]|uniref:Uncharacterized protein n=1 Tax=Leptospira vanthielii TaxID=293085 RepID=A0ABY2NSJ8_9LEPT|nr:hypothetical protein EHQ95_04275 [Leptospira vanthielii]